MTYKGRCHCAKIAFEVEGDLTDAIKCNCSICDESGYLHLDDRALATSDDHAAK